MEKGKNGSRERGSILEWLDNNMCNWQVKTRIHRTHNNIQYNQFKIIYKERAGTDLKGGRKQRIRT